MLASAELPPPALAGAGIPPPAALCWALPGGESATVFLRSGDAVYSLMRQAQDALGVPADSQQLIFRGQVLKEGDTLASCGIADGTTVQMAVGRRREKEAQMSPGGTWR